MSVLAASPPFVSPPGRAGCPQKRKFKKFRQQRIGHLLSGMSLVPVTIAFPIFR